MLDPIQKLLKREVEQIWGKYQFRYNRQWFSISRPVLVLGTLFKRAYLSESDFLNFFSFFQNDGAEASKNKYFLTVCSNKIDREHNL